MKKLALLSVCLLASTSVYAADIAAGKEKTGVCIACHGADGIATIPGYPNLKGQSAAYIEKAIKAYKSGDRKDPVMSPMATTINDEDIANIAAYYESLK
ncbi:MAG: c-type cytochrome [Vibrio sp.]